MKVCSLVVLLVLLLAGANVAWAQNRAAAPAPVDLTNPVSVVDSAGRGIAELTGRDPASGGGGLSASLSILILLTVLTVAPALLVMCTSFTRIVVVLSLLRQAMGTQSLPPSQVIVGLSLFMTLLVMAPTLQRINAEAIGPLQAGQIEQLEAWSRARQPLRDFMFAQLEYAGNEADLYLVLN